jgi:amino-acid N-acetyltransferase
MNALQKPGIRRGGSADTPAFVALLERAGLPTADIADSAALQLWVLEGNGALLGAIALERYGVDALLRSLVVVPEQRARGLGYRLVSQLEHDASAQGVERLVLLTETAEPFFRRLGYDVLERHLVSDEMRQSAEFRSLCPASALCMSKRLHS